jgi:glutathione S-transferase
MLPIVLHNYYRSSTSYRVRIALAMKGMSFTYVARHIRAGGNRVPDYLAMNPQGLVPTMVWPDGTVLGQSLAIIEFLEEIRPTPALLPPDPFGRARVRMLAQMIASDLHPVNNFRVLDTLRERYNADDAEIARVHAGQPPELAAHVVRPGGRDHHIGHRVRIDRHHAVARRGGQHDRGRALVARAVVGAAREG